VPSLTNAETDGTLAQIFLNFFDLDSEWPRRLRLGEIAVLYLTGVLPSRKPFNEAQWELNDVPNGGPTTK